MKGKVLILIISSILLILGISFVIYLNLNEISEESYTFNNPDTIELSTINESNLTLPLSVLPSNYTDTLSKNGIDLSKEEIVKLLNYGMVVIPSQFTYKTDDSNAYINDEILGMYFDNQLDIIRNEIIENEIKPLLISQLKKIQLVSIFSTNNFSLISKLKGISNSNSQYSEITVTLNSLSDEEKATILKSIDKKILNKVNYFNTLFDLPILFETTTDNQNLGENLTTSYVTSKDINEYKYKISLGIQDVISTNSFTSTTNGSFNLTKVDANLERVGFLKEISDYYVSELNKIDIKLTALNNLNTELKDNNFNNAIKYINDIEIDALRYNKFTLLSLENINGNNLLTISPLILPVDCVESICKLNEKYDVIISNNNFKTGYDLKPTSQRAGTIRVPLMMYHQIDKVPANASATVKAMYISPKDFEKQIAYLTAKNYRTVTTAQYNEILNSGKNPKQKTIMLSFDDGTKGQYENAFPILKKYKQVGVFFITSHRSSITNTQMKEMVKAGMDIQSHSATHPDFTKLTSNSELRYQIFTSKTALQYTTGVNVGAIAFPGCMWNTKTLSYMSQAGYSLGFSCGSSIDNYPKHRYVLSRIHAYKELSILIKILSGRL
ncbi:polysaccharide deacetylase family protein [Candidatus Dojkabacteria bacterium]|jgi:peptidoglycan/xylan/chitin deacetylase (PgdA/CDA1 family)|nr:polysaccharide deacetylase family protein [Candidatus Dojkabacteria bacterium]